MNVANAQRLRLDEFMELVPFDVDVFDAGMEGGILRKANATGAVTEQRSSSQGSEVETSEEVAQPYSLVGSCRSGDVFSFRGQ